MTIAFRYQHDECFWSQIDLTKLTIAKILIFSLKIHKNQVKHIPRAIFLFFLKAAMIFYISPRESH